MGKPADGSTGEASSDASDNIACWFINSDYNGESFFVRQASSLARTAPARAPKPPSRPRSSLKPGNPSTAPSLFRSPNPQPAESR